MLIPFAAGQQHKHALAFSRNSLQTAPGAPTGAAGHAATEQIAQRRGHVNPHPRRPIGRDLTAAQRDVHPAVGVVPIGGDLKAAVQRVHSALAYARHRALVVDPVLNEIGDAAQLEAVLASELDQRRAVGKFTRGIEHIGDNRRRRESRDTGVIDGALRVPGAIQHAAGLRHQREDVPGLDNIRGPGVRGDRNLHRVRPIRRGDTCSNALRRLDGQSKAGRVLVPAIDHGRQIELSAAFPGQGQTDQAAGPTRHKRDVIRRAVLRRDHHHAFVALFVALVEDHHHARVANVIEEFADTVHGGPAHAGLSA